MYAHILKGNPNHGPDGKFASKPSGGKSRASGADKPQWTADDLLDMGNGSVGSEGVSLRRRNTPAGAKTQAFYDGKWSNLSVSDGKAMLPNGREVRTGGYHTPPVKKSALEVALGLNEKNEINPKTSGIAAVLGLV